MTVESCSYEEDNSTLHPFLYFSGSLVKEPFQKLHQGCRVCRVPLVGEVSPLTEEKG